MTGRAASSQSSAPVGVRPSRIVSAPTPMDRWTSMQIPPAQPDAVSALPRPRTGGRLLILGDRRAGRQVARRLGQGSWSDMTVVGFIDSGHAGYAGRVRAGRQLALHPQTEPVPVLGRVDRLAEWVHRVGATDVVVALTGRPATRVRPQVAHLDDTAVRVHWVSRQEEPVNYAARPVPSHNHRPPWAWRLDRIAKRTLDLVGSAVGLLVLSPLFLVVAVGLLITSGWPIFYTQERVGRRGRLFRIIKFRSMKLDAETSTGPIWASNHDDRCTKFGGWLRRTNIDELPQLFNVLKGEMSLVGPRPERPIFVDHFKAAMPDYDLRHAVPGGMTGWAQVHGWRGRTSLRKRVQYDLNYIHQWSFWFDFKVLLMTYQHVFYRKIRWNPPRQRTWRSGR